MAKISIDIKAGTLRSRKEIIAGIDLGTTNSLIAYVHNGVPTVIPVSDDRKTMLPSVIHIQPDHQILIGEKARALLSSHPESTVYSVKRWMGRTIEDLRQKPEWNDQVIPYQAGAGLLNLIIHQKSFTPVELSSYILQELVAKAKSNLEVDIHKVVITVPAYFSDAQRQATRDAGKLAGLEVLRIINEPTAASMAYGLGLRPEETKHVLVYDLGGGTFDVSILRIENGIYEVLATHGDNFLGGDDLDTAIANHWLNAINPNEKKTTANELRILAEKAKVQLSDHQQVSLPFGTELLELNREQLNKLAEPFIDRTIASCKQAIRDSQLDSSILDEIILVGGSSRLLLVVDKLKEHFNRPINNFLNPDEVVAIGAAIQADILAGNRKDILLLDVTPLSLGIETVGGLMDTIIPRNSKIPIQMARNYTTSKDGQSNLKVSVYQGERELVGDNIKLAEFVLRGIPPMAAGLPKIEVRFSIDADGILSVSAKELRSQVQQSIEIRSPLQLEQEEIARRLKESVTYAQADMEIRGLVDARNEAHYILSNSERFLRQNDAELSSEEKNRILEAALHLQSALHSEDKKRIQDAVHQFNDSTADIAHRIMDLQLQKSLGGNSINQI